MHRDELERIRFGGKRDVELLQVGDRRRGQPLGELHRPGQGGRDAVVVVHEKAADASERIAEGQGGGTRFHAPVARTPAPPPRTPPYHTNPPRRMSASQSPVSSTYQIFAPTIPPITAAKTMSAANSSLRPRWRRSSWMAHPAMRKATIIMMP